MSTLKRTKPAGIFVNEYLTRDRSQFLYSLRNLKKKFPSITASYSRNGTIYYKLQGSDEPLIVNDMSEVNKLEEKMLNLKM